MNDSEQIMAAINRLTDQIRLQNGRIGTLETWRKDDVEPITDHIREIVGFTRTVARVCKFTATVCAAVTGAVAVYAIAQGWML